MKTKLNEIYDEINNEFSKNGNLDNYDKKLEDEIEVLSRKIESYNKQIIGKKASITKLIEKSKKEKMKNEKMKLCKMHLMKEKR